jgi:NAD(P)H-flavin reductase
MKSPFDYKEYEISAKSEIAPETYFFRIKGKLNFQPGQFVQVRLPHIGEATFAPCSSPYEKTFFDLCIRSTGNITDKLVEKSIGDTLFIRGPYGNGWPIDAVAEKNLIMISGGIGIIPLRPLFAQILKFRQGMKKISLLAGFRTPAHAMFGNELQALKKKFDYLKVTVEKTDKNWWGENCMITDLVEKVATDRPTIVFICGPEVMFKPVIEILQRRKVNPKNIYVSFERRMECGVGLCQHCTIGKYKVCEDGPVFRWDKIISELNK